MEEKINGLIEIIEFLVNIDRGITAQHAEWIHEMLKELKEERVVWLKIIGLVSWSILGAINIIAKRPTRFDYFFPWSVCMMLAIWSFFE